MSHCSDDTGGINPDAAKANIRVIHAVHDSGTLNIEFESEVRTATISNLTYSMSSGYQLLDPGTYQVTTRSAGDTTAISYDEFTFDSGEDYTLFLNGPLSDDNHVDVFTIVDERDSDPTYVKLRFIHLSPDAPAVDVKINNASSQPLFANVGIRDGRAYEPLPGGTYGFILTAAGQNEPLFSFESAVLQIGSSYTMITHGTMNESDGYSFNMRVFVDDDPGSNYFDLVSPAHLMLVHASPDTPPLNVLIDDQQVNSDAEPLAYQSRFPYFSVPGAALQIDLETASNGETILTRMQQFQPDQYYTLFVSNMRDQIEFVALEDDLTGVPNGAKIRLVHLSPDAMAIKAVVQNSAGVDVDVPDWDLLEFKQSSEFIELTADNYVFYISEANGGGLLLTAATVPLVTGKFYTLYVRGSVHAEGEQGIGLTLILNR